MSRRVAALGDSLSCGEGVGIHIEPDQTWAALLSHALPGASLSQLSVAGARVREVRSHQLPQALADPPVLATVLIGLNDIIRTGFAPDRFRADLTTVVGELTATGATVLMATLHDPGVMRPLPLPARLWRQLAARVAVVNDTVRDVAAGDPRIRVVDLAGLGSLRRAGAWEVDRVHPSPAGHQVIAAAAVRALRGSDLSPFTPVPAQSMPRAAGRPARMKWVVTCGIPWLVQHGGRVVPAALSMGLRESGGGDPVAATDDRGPFQAATGQPPLGSAGTGRGQIAGTPEVARALG